MCKHDGTEWCIFFCQFRRCFRALVRGPGLSEWICVSNHSNPQVLVYWTFLTQILKPTKFFPGSFQIFRDFVLRCIHSLLDSIICSRCFLLQHLNLGCFSEAWFSQDVHTSPFPKGSTENQWHLGDMNPFCFWNHELLVKYHVQKKLWISYNFIELWWIILKHHELWLLWLSHDKASSKQL